MSPDTDISTLYREFTDALTEVLAEDYRWPSTPRPARKARAAVKKHPNYSESGHFPAVENAFKNWETMQNTGG